MRCSDINACLTYRDAKSGFQRRSLSERLASALQDSDLTSLVSIIKRGHLTTLKFKTAPEYGEYISPSSAGRCLTAVVGSFDFVIGVSPTDSVALGEVLKKYLAVMPALRPLVMAAKGLIAYKRLYGPGTGGMSGFVLVYMCISFIQVSPLAGLVLGSILNFLVVDQSWKTTGGLF